MNYFIEVALFLLVFLAFYKLVLEKVKMHRFNRFFLLASMLFSVIVPAFPKLIQLPILSNTIASQDLVTYVNMNDAGLITSGSESMNYSMIFLWVYLAIVAVLTARYLYRFNDLLAKSQKNKQAEYKDVRLVLLNEKAQAHTFMNRIFVSKNDFENQKIEEEVLTHEYCHAKEKHTLDVLLVELLQIAFWVIPLWFLYKRSIQLNHEFLADDYALKIHKEVPTYQHILLDHMSCAPVQFASNINFSLTKKRFSMMTKKSSTRQVVWRSFLSISCFALLFILNSCELVAQNQSIDKDEFFKQAIVEIETDNGFVVKPYSKLTADEKKLIPPPPPPPPGGTVKPLEKGSMVTITKDMEVFEGPIKNLPPPPPAPEIKCPVGVPPPPPPPAPSAKLFREMEADGADFYLDGKSIDVEKAIDLLDGVPSKYKLSVRQNKGSQKVKFFTQ